MFVGRASVLLRNVDLFLFVNVAEKVYQATNKRDYGQRQSDPSRRVTDARRSSHKPVKIEDRTYGREQPYHNRENVFQAFHFDLRPGKISDEG
jgi:hypothetical protein